MVDRIYNWEQYLPDSISPTGIGSTNFEIFDWIAQEYLNIYRGKIQIDDWRDIDIAQGVALDNIGSNYDVFRGEATDEFYRFMIKAQILAARSKATANEIISVVAQSLNLEKTDITLENDRVLVNGQFVGTPYSISMKHLPLSFTANDFEKRYLIGVIEKSAAAGIRVSGISFLDTTNAPLGVANFTSIMRHYTSTSSVHF